MKVLDLDSMEPLDSSVLTIGNFDGVHLAHQQLLAQAGLFASSTGGQVTVLTFDPHPLSILAPDKAPPRISTTAQKLQLLEQAGAECVVIARTTPELLGIEAEQFVTDIIYKRFRPTHMVEGPTFGFGRKRRGTPQLLESMSHELNFSVHILPPMRLEIDGETIMVSSSLVRQLILDGKVRRAALCLGRYYCISGKVIEGAKRGRTIGFPTANIACVEQLLPGSGVYAGRMLIDQKPFHCALSVGTTPTFDGKSLQIEAHILDFEGDLYDRELSIEITRFIRDQVKFESADHLVAQLHKDIAQVRAFADDVGDCAN